MTTIKSVTEGKKIKSLIAFLSANKIDDYNRGEKKGKKKRERKFQKNLPNKSKHKNNKYVS